jgi:opacity protein-like surface antigen
MKNTLASLLASVAMIATAVAADLPSKAAPAAPTAASVFGLDGFYVGANTGGNFAKPSHAGVDNTPYTLGVVGGYEWNRYFRTEATFDYTSKNSPVTTNSGETVFANAIIQYPAGYGFIPYALAGVGVGYNTWGNGKGGLVAGAKELYNVGGGVRYAISKNIELDARYRYINNINSTKVENNNVVTFGANYKF